MAHKIQIKRGSKADLPTLNDGELGLCLDTNEVYVGNNGTNVPVGVQTEIVNNLTTTTTGSALDATQGKALAEQISTKIDYHDVPITTLATSLDRGDYVVSGGDSTFPYPYGHLFIVGKPDGEKTAIFQTTGADKKTYVNYCINTGTLTWVGWTGLLTTAGGTLTGDLVVWDLKQNPLNYGDVIEFGQYLDFHKAGGVTEYDVRFNFSEGRFHVTESGFTGGNVYHTGNTTISTSPPASALAEGAIHMVY